MITYHCPHCRDRLEVGDELAGRPYVCGLCGKSTTVPGAAPPPPQATVRFDPPERPAMPAVDPCLATVPRRRGDPMGSFGCGVLIPVAGLIMGLVQAFDSDPLEREKAGYSFAGCVFGMVVMPIIIWLTWWLFVARVITTGFRDPLL